jgi:glycosyltransferase involved in cell wall biosynthesis
MKNKILFFGELAPNIIHGISLANRLNINLLSKSHDIDVIEEKSYLKEHNKSSGSKIKRIFSYTKEIYKLNKKNRYNFFYTIFSLSTFGSLKTLLVILAYIISGRKQVVLHIHRGDFEVFYNKSIINKFISIIIFKLTSKLIVLSENQKEEFAKYIDARCIYVVENSLIEEYELKKKDIKNKKFIYISNYIKEKGIYELLEAFKEFDDKYLECFGGFVNNEKEIRSYESSTIKVNGFINGKEKFKKINESDALILPSWNEGQPTIILEAMMMGTIVLTTKVGLIGELLGDDYPFYFEPKDVKSLNECINKFVAYEKKEELSNRLKEVYFEKYCKSIHEEKLLKVFGE